MGVYSPDPGRPPNTCTDASKYIAYNLNKIYMCYPYIWGPGTSIYIVDIADDLLNIIVELFQLFAPIAYHSMLILLPSATVGSLCFTNFGRNDIHIYFLTLNTI